MVLFCGVKMPLVELNATLGCYVHVLSLPLSNSHLELILKLVLSEKQQVVEETEASRKIDDVVEVQMNGTIKPLYHLGVAYKGWCNP